jgi:pimeloyl-ACP methyl ester carboxylesterase
MSEEFCDVGRGITLCYETFGDPADPTALLIMGLGVQMVAWHADFCEALAARGLHVVRFDNRDIGRSTHTDGKPPTIPQMLARSKGVARYDLGDMAADTAALVERLGLGPVHAIGASMGGMIAQTLAARHARSVRSLTSIMSTTGSRRAGQPALAIYPIFMRRAPRERDAYIAHVTRVFEKIGSPGFAHDPEQIRELATVSFERDRDPDSTGRQLAAIIASGDRTSELRTITVPTLVIHGSGDRLVTPSGGRATARAITGAQLLTIPGMGHDLPRQLWPQLIDAIAEHAARADSTVPAGTEARSEHPPLQTRRALPGLQG